MTTNPQPAPFVPPAAEGLPPGVLDSATDGASALDAWARTPRGRNFLAHALVGLARDGWLRTAPCDGFEPVRERETPEPENAPAASAAVSPATSQTARLDERVQAAVRDALAVVAQNSGAGPDVAASFVASAVLAEVHRQPAVPAPAADQTDLRDRIADVLAAADDETWPADFDKTQSPNYRSYQNRADAVLAVLPASVDRAAVLREAAEVADRIAVAMGTADEDWASRARWACASVAAEFRRMASLDDQPPTTDLAQSIAAKRGEDAFVEAAALMSSAGPLLACPDPIECGHEAALGQTRETNRRLNLRTQGLESELAAYRRAVAQWEISDSRTYVPLRTLAVIAKAAGRNIETPQWLLHYQRVEQAEAAIERVRSVLESEAVVGRSALDYRGLIASALMADSASGPSRMADETQQPETQAHPPNHRWYVETLDVLANEWAPGMRFTDRTEAVERYQAVSEHHPLWKDGTPVRRRFVRETTSYTVEPEPEQPAVGAQQPKEA